MGYRTNTGTIKATDVMKCHTNVLAFDGEWLDFLGEPEPNFYMVLSAQPGHGKTTFSLKFANYLAGKFGRVVYITNEENEARIKRKLQFIGDRINPNFEMAFHADDFDKTINLLKRGRFDYVFIDSAQNAGMDFKELAVIRKQFPNIGIVAISRQTKDGKTRGSQNKEYDGDITIKFTTQGVATVVKNRFGEVGKEFILF